MTDRKDARWNRCDVDGRFIALRDFASGRAVRRPLTPDSHFTHEAYETLCPAHARLATGEREDG